MPRTKAPKSLARSMLDVVEREEKLLHIEIDLMRENALINVDQQFMELEKKISSKSGKNNKIDHLLESTQYFVNSSKPPPIKRSTSFTDEGYLTTESSNGSSGGSRVSRPRGRPSKNSSKTTSRSVSASKRNSAAKNAFKTPACKQPPPNAYGLVTPKVAPNTPQVLLRRPNQGEVALSLQGSPLLTSQVFSDNTANINIPLDDGRLFSIQPRRGLRESQVPEIDPNTQRQLKALLDNLNIVLNKAN